MSAPQQADFLTVPLLDGTRALTQVFEIIDRGVLLGLTDLRLADGATPTPCPASAFTALTVTTAEAVDTGLWHIAGFDQLPSLDELRTVTGMRALGFPDHPTHEPAIIEAFLNAWHGLYDWTAFGDLFDTMLRAGVTRS